MIVKKIELEMCFDDNFVPSEKFDKSQCTGLCPFLEYDWESGDKWCCVTAVIPVEEECPLKKYFN